MVDFPLSMSTKLGAKYLGVCEASLRAWRADGTGPDYYRAGPKLVRYRRADLDAWIEARLNAPTPKQQKVVAETAVASVKGSEEAAV